MDDVVYHAVFDPPSLEASATSAQRPRALLSGPLLAADFAMDWYGRDYREQGVRIVPMTASDLVSLGTALAKQASAEARAHENPRRGSDEG